MRNAIQWHLKELVFQKFAQRLGALSRDPHSLRRVGATPPDPHL